MPLEASMIRNERTRPRPFPMTQCSKHIQRGGTCRDLIIVSDLFVRHAETLTSLPFVHNHISLRFLFPTAVRISCTKGSCSGSFPPPRTPGGRVAPRFTLQNAELRTQSIGSGVSCQGADFEHSPPGGENLDTKSPLTLFTLLAF